MSVSCTAGQEATDDRFVSETDPDANPSGKEAMRAIFRKKAMPTVLFSVLADLSGNKPVCAEQCQVSLVTGALLPLGG
jgi:hypothetical protein